MPYILLSPTKPHMSLTEESPAPELLFAREPGGQFPIRFLGIVLIDEVDAVDDEVTVGVPDVAVGSVVVV